MANNVTPTEERRAMGLARYGHHCETCGGRYDPTPHGRQCGTGCKITPVSTAAGPYTPKRRKAGAASNGEG